MKNIKLFKVLLAVLLIAGCFCLRQAIHAQQRHITLMDGGESGYSIVIPDDADESVMHAAAELSDFLEQIGGARLAVHTARAPHDG